MSVTVDDKSRRQVRRCECACACARPCAVLKENQVHTCTGEEVAMGLCESTGICDNTPMLAAAMMPIARSLFQAGTTGAFFLVNECHE
jgi:hypothetical protein